MALLEVKIPAMGEGIIEVTLTKWLVKAGDRVNAEQPLAEVATDKVDAEIVSPAAGLVVKLIRPEGEVPRVNEVVAVLETEAHQGWQEGRSLEPSSGNHPPVRERPVNPPGQEQAVTVSKQIFPDTAGGMEFSPFIRYMARQRGISLSELKQITGTGENGKVTRDDLLRYGLSRKPAEHQADAAFQTGSGAPETLGSADADIEASPDIEVLPMDRVRKLIASRMVESKRLSPHVTSFAEADVTQLSEWRNRVREDFKLKYGVNLTLTPLFIEATVKALKAYPRINASLSGERILLKKNIHIGIATALPDGNLIVPVIKHADTLNLSGLSERVNDLVQRARENKLLPAEIKGGTFSITNLGPYKTLTGTPIINIPESAILAVGTVTKKPWAVNTSQGYGLAVREVVMLSLTYDHRIIDGALAGSFLSQVVTGLENFNPLREI